MSNTAKYSLIVWLLLMLGTAASTWWFSLPTMNATVSTLAVMLISAVKVALVMTFFMELKRAPLPWQLAGLIWLVAVSTVLIAIYLL